MSIDDGLMMKPSMKLITIEEPQKAILEPLSEVSEPPATPISPPAVDFSQAIKEPPSEVKRSPVNKGRHVVTGPPSAEFLVQKQPLEKKMSSDKKVKRIRTNSKVETAL